MFSPLLLAAMLVSTNTSGEVRAIEDAAGVTNAPPGKMLVSDDIGKKIAIGFPYSISNGVVVVSQYRTAEEVLPQLFPAGIEAPSIAITQTNGAAYGLAITPSLDVVAYPDHASPRDGWESRRAAAIASNETRMTALRALKTSPEWAKFETNKVQYATHQTQYANQTNNLTAGQVKVTDKMQQQMDDLRTMIIQLRNMLKDQADNQ